MIYIIGNGFDVRVWMLGYLKKLYRPNYNIQVYNYSEWSEKWVGNVVQQGMYNCVYREKIVRNI